MLSYYVSLRSEFRVVISYYVSLRSEFRVVMSYYVSLRSEFRVVMSYYVSPVLMRFLCKTRHKDSCAWPCLTWHCQPIKSAEYNQRETTIVSDWKPYLQQYTQIIKTPTLQTYFIYILSKLKRTRNQMTSDLYALNWKSSYDVMLLMYQRRQQHFAEF